MTGVQTCALPISFLDYKITRDFKKYITSVRIEEYPFCYHYKSLISGKFDKVKQTDFWFVMFKFKENPKNGYMEVKFL